MTNSDERKNAQWRRALGPNTFRLPLVSLPRNSAATTTDLSRTLALSETAVMHAPTGILVCDDQGIVVLANVRAKQIFGLTSDEIERRSLNELVRFDRQHHHAGNGHDVVRLSASAQSPGEQTRITGTVGKSETRVVLRVNDVVDPVNSNRLIVTVIDYEDGDEASFSEFDRIVSDNSLTDSGPTLCSLPELRGHIESALAAVTASLSTQEDAPDNAVRSSSPVGVIIIDIDRYSQTSAMHGKRVAGDMSVITASRVVNVLRTGDYVARMGPDRFAVVVGHEGSERELANTAEEIRAATDRPMIRDERAFPITCSVAFATVTKESSFDQLLDHASEAISSARPNGGNLTLLLGGRVRGEASRHQHIVNGLANAIANGELDVAFQPIFGTASGDVYFCEALMRWRHPTLGTVPPAEFIPIAEAHGYADEFGEWILDATCAALSRWRTIQPDLRASLNMTADQLLRRHAVDRVVATVERHHLPTSALIIELTERAVVGDESVAEAALNQLHAAGMTLALDDFGTGYSSLRTLRRFPFSILKLDGSLLAGLHSTSGEWGVVESVVRLAESLGMLAIAEHVETSDQLDKLAEMGCPFVQGYLMATPQPTNDIEAVLAQWSVATLG